MQMTWQDAQKTKESVIKVTQRIKKFSKVVFNR